MRIIGVIVLVGFTACRLEPDLMQCGELLCAADSVCVEDRVCIGPEDARACAGHADGEPCSTSKVEDGICGSGACVTPGCGNWVIEAGEMCDDGNTVLDDGCAADCRSDESCGNGVLDFHETCDDGNLLSSDGCSSACRVEHLELTFAERPGPHAMITAAAAYAPDWQTLVLFNRNQTWMFKNGAWTRGPDGPSDRVDTTLAYDAKRQRIVLFGGYVPALGSGQVLQDTWELDGTSWTKTVNGPMRAAHRMVYDPVREKIVMFGGTASYSYTPLGTTYTYDGATWTLLSLASPPAARTRTAMTWDSARQAIVMFGGSNASGPLTDLWQLNGTGWSQLATVGPTTNQPSLAYDSARSRLVLVGDKQVWEATATTWVERTDITLANTYFSWFAAFDSARLRTVIFGGSESQHWELDAGVHRHAFRPGELSGTRIVFDIAARRVVLHGGLNVETWARAADGTWTLFAPTTTAQPPRGSELVYDPARRRVVAFGDTATEAQTWILDDTSWTELATAQPPRRIDTAMVYDNDLDRIVLFGGVDPVSGEPLGDTWVFANDVWSPLTSTSSPDPRGHPPLAYDPHRHRVVLAGGEFDGWPVADTWELDGDRWTETEPMPVLRGHGVLTYDQARRRSTLLAGWEPGIGGDEDVLEFDGAAWSYVFATPAPDFETGAQVNYDVTYDPFAHALLAIGVAGPVDPWALGYLRWTDGTPVDSCTGLDDLDLDTLRGCDDPDCYGYCDPTCPPGATCPAPRARCGDSTCDAALENHDRCPGDCP